MKIELMTAVIYNRKNLSEDLKIDDEHFLMDYISENGFDRLKDVNGDFAGVLSENNKWYLFRDHMGVSQLYYYLKDDTFFYSDSIQKICSYENVDLRINEKWFYLETSAAVSFSQTETEFQYIHAIRPGSWCEFECVDNQWHMLEHLYWQPGRKKIRYTLEDEYIKELRRLIEDSVRIRLNKFDGVIGAELSGGLDSGVVDLLICREKRKAFFISWSPSYQQIPMQSFDERRIIEDICAQEQVSFSFLPQIEPEIKDAIGRNLPPFINTIQISETAKVVREAGCHVIFSGHGGDEGVSHRASLLELLYNHEYRSYFSEVYSRNAKRKFPLLRSAKQIVKDCFCELPKMKNSWKSEALDLSAYLNPIFLNKIKKEVNIPPLLFFIDPTQYILQGGSRSRLDNCDSQSKEFGVRYVFPFLDYRVVDFAVSIPRKMYFRNGVNRYIFREAFKDIMPESLYYLNRKDFPSVHALQQIKAKENSSDRNKSLKKQYENNVWLLNQLDWSMWGEYWNRAACEALLLQNNNLQNQKERSRYLQLTEQLYKCLIIQKLRKK